MAHIEQARKLEKQSPATPFICRGRETQYNQEYYQRNKEVLRIRRLGNYHENKKLKIKQTVLQFEKSNKN
jgi:hypothetical protein